MSRRSTRTAFSVASSSILSVTVIRPACSNKVSADTFNASAIDLRTRTDGSCSPRSTWLRYGLETSGQRRQLSQRQVGHLSLRTDERPQQGLLATCCHRLFRVHHHHEPGCGSGRLFGDEDAGQLQGKVALSTEQVGGEVDS